MRLRRFISSAAGSAAAVLLVGLPRMRDAVDNADALEKSRMFADAVAKLGHQGIEYVEPWKLKTTEPDVFASYGPDASGRLVQVRTSDGQHFATGGEDMLATCIFPKIAAALAAAGTSIDACAKQAKDVQ